MVKRALSQSYQTFFSFNLGYFIIRALFAYVTNTQAQQQKSENLGKLRFVELALGQVANKNCF
jgi:hypothetical protein